MPFSVIMAKTKLFYGWIIVVASGMMIVSTMVGHTTGVSMAVDHFLEDLQLTRTRMSAIWTLSLFISGMGLPVAGALLDHCGSRKMAAFVSVPFGISIVGMSLVQNGVQLAACLIVLRFLGPECIILIASTLPNHWFVAQRGKVAAFLSLFDVMNIAFSSIFEAIIRAFGWRKAYVIVGSSTAAILVVCNLLIRNDPKSMGLKPDGGTAMEEPPGDVELTSGAAPSASTKANEDVEIEAATTANVVTMRSVITNLCKYPSVNLLCDAILITS